MVKVKKLSFAIFETNALIQSYPADSVLLNDTYIIHTYYIIGFVVSSKFIHVIVIDSSQTNVRKYGKSNV